VKEEQNPAIYTLFAMVMLGFTSVGIKQTLIFAVETKCYVAESKPLQKPNRETL